MSHPPTQYPLMMKGALEKYCANLAASKSRRFGEGAGGGGGRTQRARVHKKELFLKAKGTQTKNFHFERKKQGMQATKILKGAQNPNKNVIFLSGLLGCSFLVSG